MRESFNGALKDEFINREIFYGLTEARIVIERWLREYNEIRAHSSLGYPPLVPMNSRPRSSYVSAANDGAVK